MSNPLQPYLTPGPVALAAVARQTANDRRASHRRRARVDASTNALLPLSASAPSFQSSTKNSVSCTAWHQANRHCCFQTCFDHHSNHCKNNSLRRSSQNSRECSRRCQCLAVYSFTTHLRESRKQIQGGHHNPWPFYHGPPGCTENVPTWWGGG